MPSLSWCWSVLSLSLALLYLLSLSSDYHTGPTPLNLQSRTFTAAKHTTSQIQLLLINFSLFIFLLKLKFLTSYSSITLTTFSTINSFLLHHIIIILIQIFNFIYIDIKFNFTCINKYKFLFSLLHLIKHNVKNIMRVNGENQH